MLEILNSTCFSPHEKSVRALRSHTNSTSPASFPIWWCPRLHRSYICLQLLHAAEHDVHLELLSKVDFSLPWLFEQFRVQFPLETPQLSPLIWQLLSKWPGPALNSYRETEIMRSLTTKQLFEAVRCESIFYEHVSWCQNIQGWSDRSSIQIR